MIKFIAVAENRGGLCVICLHEPLKTQYNRTCFLYARLSDSYVNICAPIAYFLLILTLALVLVT